MKIVSTFMISSRGAEYLDRFRFHLNDSTHHTHLIVLHSAQLYQLPSISIREISYQRCVGISRRNDDRFRLKEGVIERYDKNSHCTTYSRASRRFKRTTYLSKGNRTPSHQDFYQYKLSPQSNERYGQTLKILSQSALPSLASTKQKTRFTTAWEI